eukprot:2681525-Rhodomonas_salina.2
MTSYYQSEKLLLLKNVARRPSAAEQPPVATFAKRSGKFLPKHTGATSFLHTSLETAIIPAGKFTSIGKIETEKAMGSSCSHVATAAVNGPRPSYQANCLYDSGFESRFQHSEGSHSADLHSRSQSPQGRSHTAEGHSSPLNSSKAHHGHHGHHGRSHSSEGNSSPFSSSKAQHGRSRSVEGHASPYSSSRAHHGGNGHGSPIFTQRKNHGYASVQSCSGRGLTFRVSHSRSADRRPMVTGQRSEMMRIYCQPHLLASCGCGAREDEFSHN